VSDVTSSRLLATALVGAWLATATAAMAQQPATPPPPVEQTDVWEWLRHLRHKESPTEQKETEATRRKTNVLLVPIIGSEPSTGFTFGAGVSVEFPLGALSDTYVSSVLTGASVSTKKFFSLSARLALFGSGNRWTIGGDNHYQLTGQDTYGLGTDTTSADRVTARFNSVKFVDTYLHRLPHDLYAGIGFQFQGQNNIRPADNQSGAWAGSEFVAYSEAYGFNLSRQTSAGFNAELRHDSRDNVSDPSRGWYGDAMYRAYIADFLGGDSTWQRLIVDARTYRRLGTSVRRQELAFWGFGDFVTAGHAPYFTLPATGTDAQGRSGRGYAEGRFRGDRLVYGEVEYRVSLRPDGLVGMVAFLNATTVGSTFADESLFDDVALGAGFGFRLRLDKRSRTNVCLDFGFGRDGSHGIYIALAEAF
jgi:hypothetical protein